MAISHTCAFCGGGLTTVRPVIDPHYRLPLVHCPSCGRACVRRRHPIWRGWRTFLRVKASLLMLFAQTLFAVALGFYTVWLARILAEAYRTETIAILFDPEEIHVAYALAIVPIMTGLWLAGALAHLRRITAWTAWAGWCALLLLVVEALLPAMTRLKRTGHWRVMSEDMTDYGWSMAGLAVLLGISAAAIPLGRLLTRAFENGRRSRWRRRRRRWRAARSAG